MFKGIRRCTFERKATSIKYECKLIFMNRIYDKDYYRIYEQVKLLEAESDIDVLPVVDEDKRINIYYIIYSKDKDLTKEIDLGTYTDYNNQFSKSISTLFFKSLGGVAYISSSIYLFFRYLTYYNSYFISFLDIVGWNTVNNLDTICNEKFSEISNYEC